MTAYAHSKRRERLSDADFTLAAPAITPRALVLGSKARLVVLSAGPEECVAVDRASGAFVRVELAGIEQPALERYDIVVAELAVGEEVPDPARPEAARLADAMYPVGRLKGRRSRRFLESLLAPPTKDLLGFAGPSTTYWTISGTDPSVALVKPERGPQLFLRDDGVPFARFAWGRVQRQLPVTDPALVSALGSGDRGRLAPGELEAALGFKTAYLLIALTRPRDGHCYKTVAAALPRP
jgi:hypothetical protein